jgi:LuxR family transcriptional regulator, maltose regulon positive regulatory protein
VAEALAFPRSMGTHSRPTRLFRNPTRRIRPQRVPVVERRRLLHVLAAGAEVPIVVISAPAGYGKSILAAQWSAQCARPAAVLSLDGGDNDPIVLLDYLVEALDSLAPIAPELLEELSSPDPNINEVVLPGLAEELERVSPIELILDNIQEVSEPGSLEVLTLLLEQMPPGSQLMLLTRADPELPLASHRVSGDLLELRADQLAFDFDETRSLSVRRGIGLAEPSLKVIHERTEGWAAGIALAVAAAEELAPGEDPCPVRGTQRGISDYLIEAVLERATEPQQAFLLATSVLHRMTAPLCDTVLGMTGASKLLGELERSNSFLIPLDDHRGWYRYHHLFREFLRSELDRRHPGLAAMYLARAAEWHEREGCDSSEAFRCAHECGDLARTGRIALGSLDGSMAPAQHEMMRAWLQDCTGEEISSDPQLAIAAAWISAGMGEGPKAERYALAAERGDLEGPSADGASSIRSSLANLRAALAYRGVHQMLADAEHVYAAERETSGRWLADSCRAIGMAKVLLGRPDEAIAALREALMLSDAPELSAGRMFCLGYLAFAAADAGHWPEARKWAREAKALSAERDLSHHLPAPIAFTARATVLAQDGDLYRAGQELEDATALGHLLRGARWLTADMELRWGELSLHLGDRLKARDHAGRAAAALNGYCDSGTLEARLVALEERLARAADLQLTPAELRILPFLPTHLLVKEIAARLHLSAATVKSHLHGIFNKLDVSTRSEAVDKMELLGLEAARALPPAPR